MEDSVVARRHIEVLQGRAARLTQWIAGSTLDPADYDTTTKHWAEELEALQWALPRLMGPKPR